MRHNKLSILFGILTCLFSACNGDMTDSITTLDDDILKLNFWTIDSRADLDETGAGSFSENDKIGLYIDNGTTVAYRELTWFQAHGNPLCDAANSVKGR